MYHGPITQEQDEYINSGRILQDHPQGYSYLRWWVPAQLHGPGTLDPTLPDDEYHRRYEARFADAPESWPGAHDGYDQRGLS